jgi:hypothetical protein
MLVHRRSHDLKAKGHSEPLRRARGLRPLGERCVSHDLPSLCAVLAGAVGGRSWRPQCIFRIRENTISRVIASESFCVTDAGQMTHLRSYIADALLPCMDQFCNSPRICLEAVVARHAPQSLLLAVYPGFNEMLEMRTRIASDWRVNRARL